MTELWILSPLASTSQHFRVYWSTKLCPEIDALAGNTIQVLRPDALLEFVNGAEWIHCCRLVPGPRVEHVLIVRRSSSYRVGSFHSATQDIRLLLFQRWHSLEA